THSPKGARLVGWGVWSMSVEARDRDGKPVWKYGSEDAIDWAAPADLGLPDGDAVVLGYNGGGGVRAINPDGSLRWRASGLGNVWSVGAARLSKAGPASAICVNDMSVPVFDVQGKQATIIKTPKDIGAVYGADLD